MKRTIANFLSVFLIASCAGQKVQGIGSALVADPELVKPVAQCEDSREDSKRYVAFLKQWHLSPKANTVSSDPKTFEQFENQYALYKQLEKWIEAGVLKTVVVEGCEGMIDDDFDVAYNGLALQDLMELNKGELDLALTQMGIKIKARFGDRVDIYCGDNNELIARHGLILSDIRGFVGFYERIMQAKIAGKSKEEQFKRYASSAAKVLGRPASEAPEKVLELLRSKIRARLDEFEAILHARNESFIGVIDEIKSPTIAVVLGGLHTTDFYERLSSRGDSCDFFEPAGYFEGEGEILKTLRERF